MPPAPNRRLFFVCPVMDFPSRPDFIERLQARLAGPLPGLPAQLRMAHAVRRAEPAPEPAEVREAAVLIALYERSEGDWHLVFIRRVTTGARDKHSGQVAFPGGKRDPGDPDLLYTALREAHEEVSLDLRQVDVLGYLTPLYITVSRFRVHPFVAYVPSVPDLSGQASEIESILELPLSAFRIPGNLQTTHIRLDAGIVLNHVPAFVIDGQVIWGATAMILSELLEVIGPDPDRSPVK